MRQTVPPVKIALVHYTYSPVIGGVEIIMAEHARLFAEHGHEVTVFCDQGASDDARIAVELLPGCHRCGRVDASPGARIRGAGRDFRAQRRHHALPSRLDGVHLGPRDEIERQSGSLRGCMIWRRAIPTTVFRLSNMPPWSYLARAHPRVEYVAVSNLRRRQFEKLTRVPCRVIPNGLEPERLLGLTAPVAELARTYHLLEREIVLLHPTRLLKRKNVELGLRVAAALNAAGRNCAYIVTGPPDPHNAGSRLCGGVARPPGGTGHGKGRALRA